MSNRPPRTRIRPWPPKPGLASAPPADSGFDLPLPLAGQAPGISPRLSASASTAPCPRLPETAPRFPRLHHFPVRLTALSAGCYAVPLKKFERDSSLFSNMDATLRALAGILLRAIPTFLLVIVLHFYLKFVFFKPLDKVLRKRYEATEGARKLAEESLERAAAKTAQYEEAIRTAKAEIYKSQEQLHKKLQENEAARIQEARQRTEAAIQKAKAELAADVAAAQISLSGESEALAGEIADSILKRSAA